jgi:hypothetical protein
MKTSDLTILIITALNLPISIIALSLPLMEKAIIALITVASLMIPAVIAIKQRKKKLPLFPFIPFKYYIAFMVLVISLQCVEATILLYIGINYMVLLPAIIQLPIIEIYIILLSAIFACCIAMGILLIIVACLLSYRLLQRPPQLDLTKELKS